MLASLMQCMVLNWNLILYRCQGYDTAIIPYLIVSWFAVIHKPAYFAAMAMCCGF